MTFPGTADLNIIVEVYLGADPTADPNTWPAATDLSSRLMRKPIQVRRGRNRGQQTLSSGSCTLWLENTDGALTPLLSTSTYFPDWDLGVPMRVSVDGVGPNPPYVRFAGFVADVSARMVPGTNGVNISAVQVTLGGVWRRISQGAVAKSALRRVYESAAGPALTAYWPFEDGTDATVIASGLPSGMPLSGTAVVLTDGIDGSAGALDLVQVDTLLTAVVPLPSNAGFQIEVSALTNDPGGANLWLVSSGNLTPIYISLLAALADGLPHHIAYRFVQNGTTVDATVYRDGVFSSTTSLGTAQLDNSVTLRFPTTGAAFAAGSIAMLAHTAVYAFDDMDVPSARAGAVDAWAGEQAHLRAERVCAEEGIPFSGTANLSNECGPQPVDDVTGVLVDLEQVDHGMIVEDFAWGLDYRASSQRENLDPRITIDLATYRTTAGTQADVLTPVRNDARMRNEWTISRPAGSSATAKDETHQARKGRYNDAATVNVEDDTRILDEAQWRVHEGTFDGLRYQTVPLDIAANID